MLTRRNKKNATFLSILIFNKSHTTSSHPSYLLNLLRYRFALHFLKGSKNLSILFCHLSKSKLSVFFFALDLGSLLHLFSRRLTAGNVCWKAWWNISCGSWIFKDNWITDEIDSDQTINYFMWKVPYELI